MPLSNQPPKGTSDWFPEEFIIRKYIFDVWRRVCQRYGYEEYLTPLVEAAEIYRVKSGENVGGKELVTFTDAGGRELSIRPEMTPSVTRLVSQIYEAKAKPIRFFSIANFMRNEKPQRGRNREFWQLNCDIFGSDSVAAATEVMQIALDIMLELGAPAGSFKLAVNSRRLLDSVLNLAAVVSPQQKIAVMRLLDKWQKLSLPELRDGLTKLGVAGDGQKKLLSFVQAGGFDNLVATLPELAESEGLREVKAALSWLTDLGYGQWLEFQPSVVRGLDYYDGLVFEVFDNHPDNKRAMFGGGRYNGLAGIFDAKPFPAVGFAPGDETTRLFLSSWGLEEKIRVSQDRRLCYLPILEDSLRLATAKLARQLRDQGKIVEVGLEAQKITKALETANQKNAAETIILGEAELTAGLYKIKDMASGQESAVNWRPL